MVVTDAIAVTDSDVRVGEWPGEWRGDSEWPLVASASGFKLATRSGEWRVAQAGGAVTDSDSDVRVGEWRPLVASVASG